LSAGTKKLRLFGLPALHSVVVEVAAQGFWQKVMQQTCMHSSMTSAAQHG